MAAPLLALSALAKARTARRVALTLFLPVTLVLVVILSPLLVVPLALAGAPAQSDSSALSGSAPVAEGDWGYPLAGSYRKGRGFGHNPVKGCSYCSTEHKGYDMAQGCGSTVYAAGGGVVTVAGSYFGWGNTVLIDHGDGLETLYGHMQWGSLQVAVGQHVTVGARIGTEGSTGHSTGCHLHYEVRKSGVAIDPQPFMAALGLPLK
ncbi:murein DD-endopeptidase MepM/ murein hydrolase activator NlpD [Microbacterium sp. W4I4]|uniref:M23 family metallopeptidase n=1 Tax=Microbacterium sp. W4I4 TaxID=3042295 RepID=UPI00278627AB|nr:M23 family metallopeptidase [Microbacterium sp. W4I4]MDQ0615326.1 murein DD-endopeptidase MepM/ murein hydrolase activator NlpD [Microbacterium sp. W4I4]